MQVRHELNEEIINAALTVRKWHVFEEQMRKFEGYASEILSRFGFLIGGDFYGTVCKQHGRLCHQGD